MKISNAKQEQSVTMEAPLCDDFDCKNVTFYLQHWKPQQLVETNAFEVLMQPNLMSLTKINSPDAAKDCLFSDIILLFEQLNMKFWNGSVDILGKSLVDKLTNLLWYMICHYQYLQERKATIPNLFKTFKV